MAIKTPNSARGLPGLLRSPRSFAGLSICAAIATFSLKLFAYRLTGSVGLLSDAMESVVNLTAAVVAFWMLTLAALPPDEEHAYGHTKAEYFSSGVEAILILVAAASIAWTAWGRLTHPQPLENVWLGLAFSTFASAVNGGVALVLFGASKRLHSITLRADGAHLMTDVWTSAGVIVAVILVSVTHLYVLDPIVAFVVAANILWTSFRLLNDSVHGLLDTALPAHDLAAVNAILSTYEEQGVHFHAFRSRVSGQRRFISVHVLVPGEWTVQQGHDLVEEIEHKVIAALPKCTITTHLEPLEDPAAFRDQHLDRG